MLQHFQRQPRHQHSPYGHCQSQSQSDEEGLHSQSESFALETFPLFVQWNITSNYGSPSLMHHVMLGTLVHDNSFPLECEFMSDGAFNTWVMVHSIHEWWCIQYMSDGAFNTWVMVHSIHEWWCMSDDAWVMMHEWWCIQFMSDGAFNTWVMGAFNTWVMVHSIHEWWCIQYMSDDAFNTWVMVHSIHEWWCVWW